MKRIITYTMLILAILMPLSITAQQKMKLAVLDPVDVGDKLPDGIKISVREIISSTFVNNADNYSIVERSLLDKVIQEAQFSNSDAVDESQATRLGKLAGADRVVLSVISKFDSRCMISIKLINVETATIDRQLSKMVDYNSILDVTEPLTLAILGKGDLNFSVPSKTEEKQIPQENTANNTKSNNTKPEPQTGSAILSGYTFTPTEFKVGYQLDFMPSTKMEKVSYCTNYNVLIDFSEANVSGLNFNDFINSNLEESVLPDFESEMKRLIMSLNKMKDYKFSYNQTSPITLLVKVREIDRDGRTNTSDFVFVDNDTKEILAGVRIKSKGGRFGSFPNLLGDAFEEDAAPKFLKHFKKALKDWRK